MFCTTPGSNRSSPKEENGCFVKYMRGRFSIFQKTEKIAAGSHLSGSGRVESAATVNGLAGDESCENTDVFTERGPRKPAAVLLVVVTGAECRSADSDAVFEVEPFNIFGGINESEHCCATHPFNADRVEHCCAVRIRHEFFEPRDYERGSLQVGSECDVKNINTVHARQHCNYRLALKREMCGYRSLENVSVLHRLNKDEVMSFRNR